MGTSMGPRFGMRTLLVAVAVVALLAALIAATGRAMRNRIVVENRSGVAVKVITITVGPTAISLGELPPGRTVQATYSIPGDAHSTVTGRLADGTPLGGNFGYVTGGMYGETARFSIEPGGKIEFSQAR